MMMICGPCGWRRQTGEQQLQGRDLSRHRYHMKIDEEYRNNFNQANAEYFFKYVLFVYRAT